MSDYEHLPITRLKPPSYAELTQKNAMLQQNLQSAERRIQDLQQTIENIQTDIEVRCSYCEREVPEDRAVCPQGQGIWFCRVCDDELTRLYVQGTMERGSR